MRIGRATSSQVNKNSSSGLLPVTELTHTLAWGKWPCTACEPGWNLAPISSHIIPVLYFLCEKKVITDKMLKLNWIAGFKLKSATLNPFPPQCCFDWGMFVWHCPSAMTLIQINFHTGSCGGSFFFFFLAAFPLVQDQGHTLICFHGEWYFLWLIKLPPFNSPRQTAQLLSGDGHDRA